MIAQSRFYYVLICMLALTLAHVMQGTELPLIEADFFSAPSPFENKVLAEESRSYCYVRPNVKIVLYGIHPDDEHNKYGRSALLYDAVRLDDSEEVRFLLKYGANPKVLIKISNDGFRGCASHDKDAKPLLSFAKSDVVRNLLSSSRIRFTKKAMLKRRYVLRQISFNFLNERIRYATEVEKRCPDKNMLWNAVESQDARLVCYLIQHKADPNIVRYGDPLLFQAHSWGVAQPLVDPIRAGCKHDTYEQGSLALCQKYKVNYLHRIASSDCYDSDLIVPVIERAPELLDAMHESPCYSSSYGSGFQTIIEHQTPLQKTIRGPDTSWEDPATWERYDIPISQQKDQLDGFMRKASILISYGASMKLVNGYGKTFETLLDEAAKEWPYYRQLKPSLLAIFEHRLQEIGQVLYDDNVVPTDIVSLVKEYAS